MRSVTPSGRAPTSSTPPGPGGSPPPLRAQFTIPDLRPGTLDSLLALSDDLVKYNIFIEGISHKIRRQIKDLEHAVGVEPGTLTVDGVPIDSYLTGSVSGRGQCCFLHCSSAYQRLLTLYPVNTPLKETFASIQSQAAKIEDDMKPEVYEFKIGGQFFRRPGDPPLDQVIEILQKHKDKSQDEI
ncbi:V-type proton ATPase subunit C [Triticum aestivum]|nr:V-type proton ATPase subunit C-like [Triticum aestivum]XP_044429066.1 V-type proton ATPase subunit C-like [Triticum aestivum]XP_044429067.1 V-type proton ATPase subunit C-like [Triticum aestivum]